MRFKVRIFLLKSIHYFFGRCLSQEQFCGPVVLQNGEHIPYVTAVNNLIVEGSAMNKGIIGMAEQRKKITFCTVSGK
jgi:hypothetical protein